MIMNIAVIIKQKFTKLEDPEEPKKSEKLSYSGKFALLDEETSGEETLEGEESSEETSGKETQEAIEINGIFWNRRYEAKCVERDAKIKSKFKTLNINVQTYNGKVLVEPWNIKGKQNQSLRVFTPYKNSLLGNHLIPECLPVTKIKFSFSYKDDNFNPTSSETLIPVAYNISIIVNSLNPLIESSFLAVSNSLST